ncbi:MAG TPA: alpha/beta hydrolase [Candidatus Baltobacteraceae bacterium]|nr:alpha/beta hydrolase [Candidatus Baltobacteraceae bacterium]
MRIPVDDATIDVRSEGSGDPIVLIHGFPLTREVWDLQAAQLAAHARVIRPDLRGMGSSSVPDGPYLMETLAGDIAAMLDALGIDRAAIAGHSLGGYVAMAFCRMYTERVTRLALVCSKLAADTAQTAKWRDDLADRAEREDRIDTIVDAFVPRLFAPNLLENRSPLIDRARTIARENSVKGAAAMLRGMAQRVEAYDIAEELGMPVLIVAGAADQGVSLTEAEGMRRAFPHAELRVLGRSGHLPMLEEPEALGEALATFLRASGRDL